LFDSLLQEIIVISIVFEEVMVLNSGIVLICSKCNLRVFNLSRPFHLTTSRSYRWKPDTHYDVLGVHPDATQAEIKVAYLNLSKELHPDLNQRSTAQDKEAIHQQFVKVNQAYSVLGNQRERRAYDLQNLIQSDPRRGKGDREDGNPGSAHSFSGRPMTFDERARAMGYKTQDPEFYKKHGNYHRKIVLGCIIWILFGSVLTFSVIMYSYTRHATELDYKTKQNYEILQKARDNAKKFASTKEQGEELNRKWMEEQKKRQW